MQRAAAAALPGRTPRAAARTAAEGSKGTTQKREKVGRRAELGVSVDHHNKEKKKATVCCWPRLLPSPPARHSAPQRRIIERSFTRRS